MALRHATFEFGAILPGTSITGSYQTIFTATQDLDFLSIGSTCDVNLLLRVPSVLLSGVVTTAELPILARQAFIIDLRSFGKRLAAGAIEVKHAGVAPTSGSFTAFGAY